MTEFRTAYEVRRVFISSTTRDLAQYREVAQQVINSVSTNFSSRFILTPVSMDTQGQDGESQVPLEVSKNWVREQCDWVVLIVGWHYGYIPPGQPPDKTVSVTEAEYITAMECEKKCFVFLAGDLEDPKPIRYRAMDDQFERENLADWRNREIDPGIQMAMGNFRKRLREKRLDIFKNIEDFQSKLNRALTQRIISELFRTMGPDIIRLELLKPLRSCLEEVKLLARLKRLHDTLHHIRQFGIRTWREELVASWPDDGDPTIEATIKYLEAAPDIVRLIERIRNIAIRLPPSEKFMLRQLETVATYELPRIKQCNKDDFIDSTESFASRVQNLFSSCDSQMGRSASRLNDFYRNLAASTRRALDFKRIDPGQDALLRAELDRSMQNHARVQHVLENHRRWQQVHDKLELIDVSIENETSQDDDEKRLAKQKKFSKATSYFIESDGDEVKGLLSAATDIATQEERLREWPKLIITVGKHLENFLQQPEVEHYEAMRKHFDDLFFEVDLETLRVIEIVEDRVRAIETGLQYRDPINEIG